MGGRVARKVTNVAEIQITVANARALNDARAIAFSTKGNFAALSQVWSLAYLAGKESEWAPISGCWNPFHRLVDTAPEGLLTLTPAEWQMVLYRPWGPAIGAPAGLSTPTPNDPQRASQDAL